MKNYQLSLLSALFTSVALLLNGCSGGTKMTSVDSEFSQEEKQIEETVKEFDRVVGDRIYFAYNDYSLSTDAKAELLKQVEWMKSHQDYKAVLEGYCDDRGTVAYNLALGAKRATAAQEFMVSNGIQRSRLDTVSYGKSRPYAIGTGEDVWKLNRRVVTVVYE